MYVVRGWGGAFSDPRGWSCRGKKKTKQMHSAKIREGDNSISLSREGMDAI